MMMSKILSLENSSFYNCCIFRLQNLGQINRTIKVPVFFFAVMTCMVSADIAVAQEVELDQKNLILLEDITVTAKRYESELQDIPANVHVISGEDIRRKGIGRLSEALRLIPNLTVYDDGGSYNSSISMRGIGTEIPFTAPAVTVFVDGVPYSGSVSDFDLQNVERIEVIAGPQSSLYGQTTLAGTVNVITRAPQQEEWNSRVSTKVGDHAFRGASISVTGPIIKDQVGLSLNVSQSESDGYFKNTTTGNDKVGGTGNKNLHSVINISATPDIEAAISFDYKKDIGAKIDSVARNAYEFARPEDPSEKRRSSQTSVSIKWQGESLNASSLTGYRKVDLDLFDNMALVTGNPTRNNVDIGEQALFQEFRLSQPKKDGLSWQAGIYLSDESLDINQDFALPTPFFTAAQDWDYEQHSKYREIYGQMDLEFVKDWTFTFGGRHSNVKRDVDINYNSSGLAALGVPDSSFLGDTKKNFSNTLGNLALTYRTDQGFTVYTAINQGFKAGAARSGAIDNAGLFLPSETVDTYEIGLKGTTQSLRYGATIFYADYENRHTFYNDPGTVPVVVAVPQAVTKGVELDLLYSMHNSSSLFAKVGYLNTSFGDFVLPGTATNILGNEFRDAPEWSLTIGSSYETTIDDWTLFASSDFTFRTEAFGNVSNSPISENPSYGIMNAAVGLTRGKFGLSLQVNNLFDRYYYNTTAISDGTGAPGAPRSFYITANYEL